MWFHLNQNEPHRNDQNEWNDDPTTNYRDCLSSSLNDWMNGWMPIHRKWRRLTIKMLSKHSPIALINLIQIWVWEKKIKFDQNSILFRFFSRFIFHENKSSENRKRWRKDACRTNQLIFYWYEWNRYRLEFLVFFVLLLLLFCSCSSIY